MAQYKVPQDVEADDKLLGPFTFRQFVYLMIMGGFVGLAFALFQIFWALALFAVPFIIFFAVLALPLKKDQPMETYLAAVISFRLKPNKRFWNPGQRESTILITAPKKSEEPRTRNITEEEAGNRIDFLANVIDTEGYAVRGGLNNVAFREEFIEEANATQDVMDVEASPVINEMLAKQQNDRHQEMLNQMRSAISKTEAAKEPTGDYPQFSGTTINPISSASAVNPAAMAAPTTTLTPQYPGQTFPANIQSTQPTMMGAQPVQAIQQPTTPARPSAALNNLANINDYTVATLSKEAARMENNNRRG